MTLTVRHAKESVAAELTQADLDLAIANRQYPPGTTLEKIIQASDWNEEHEIEGTIAAEDVEGLAPVATSGSYNDLSDTPTIPASYTNEEAQDAVGTILTDTATIDLTYTDGTPSITADVKTNSIGDTHLAQGAAVSVYGVTGSATANKADIVSTAANQVLRRASIGTSIGWGAINLASTAAVSGTLPVSNGGTGATSLTSNALLKGNSTSAVLATGITVDATTNAMYGFGAKPNPQTGTSYTLTQADNGKIITFNNGSTITVTVPSGLTAGFNCLLVQLGAGQVSLSASGSTILNRQSHTKLAGQYAYGTLISHVANSFVFGGDTAA